MAVGNMSGVSNSLETYYLLLLLCTTMCRKEGLRFLVADPSIVVDFNLYIYFS